MNEQLFPLEIQLSVTLGMPYVFSNNSAITGLCKPESYTTKQGIYFLQFSWNFEEIFASIFCMMTCDCKHWAKRLCLFLDMPRYAMTKNGLKKTSGIVTSCGSEQTNYTLHAGPAKGRMAPEVHQILLPLSLSMHMQAGGSLTPILTPTATSSPYLLYIFSFQTDQVRRIWEWKKSSFVSKVFNAQWHCCGLYILL